MLRTPPVDEPVDEQMVLEQARQVFASESQALADLTHRVGETFVRAVQWMFDAPGDIVVTGVGKAGLIGQKIAATLASTGTRSHFLHPTEAQHGDLGRVAEADVVLAFSHSGQTRELVEILPHLRELGASIVAVTSRADSQLAAASDVVIEYGRVEEACPIGLAPSTSCAVMLAIGDALAFSLMRQRGFEAQDFGRYHPAGSLGRKLQRVEDVMRSGDQVRIAPSQLSVREVFVSVQRPGRRSGAVCLVDGDGRLEGLFTDSDLARLLERCDIASLSQPIAEFMTRRPITVTIGGRVQDAVNVLRRHHISEVPVLDIDGRPVGMIDITDLVDLLPEAA